ncbi:MAG: hypothetical protein ABIR68_12540 [Ilumatobacteraceae bacterium]
MIRVDLRLAVLMVLAAVATAAAPLALGGAIAVAGVIAAILAARSVVRGDETSVSTAIIGGGLVAASALSRGPSQAWLVVAGVFVAAELASLGRRLAIDREAPAGPEVRISLATIGLGVGVGAVVAVVSLWHARPPVANIALAALLVFALIAFGARQLRPPAG